MIDILWWIALGCWAVGFTLSMTRLKATWSAACYIAGCGVLITSAFADPKIDTTTASVVTAVMTLCAGGIAWTAVKERNHAEQEVEQGQVDGVRPEEEGRGADHQ